MYLAGANGFIVGTSSLLNVVDYFRNIYSNYTKASRGEV